MFHYYLFSQVISRFTRQNDRGGTRILQTGQTAELWCSRLICRYPGELWEPRPRLLEREIRGIIRGIKSSTRGSESWNCACTSSAMITENGASRRSATRIASSRRRRRRRRIVFEEDAISSFRRPSFSLRDDFACLIPIIEFADLLVPSRTSWTTRNCYN